MLHIPSVSVKSEVLVIDKSEGGSVGLNTLFFVSFRKAVLLLVLIEVLTNFLFVLLCTPLLLLFTFELFVRGFLLTPAPTFFPFRLLKHTLVKNVVINIDLMYN